MSEFFLHSFNTLSHGFVGYIIPFLFVLTIVVFFHELGHFLVARWAGVKVLTFSLGFGPELVGFNDRYGTRWKISAVPLGGYVKFFGDDSEASTPSSETLSNMTEEERAGSFHHKNVGPHRVERPDIAHELEAVGDDPEMRADVVRVGVFVIVVIECRPPVGRVLAF